MLHQFSKNSAHPVVTGFSGRFAYMVGVEFELTADRVVPDTTPGTIVIIPSAARHSGRAITPWMSLTR